MREIHNKIRKTSLPRPAMARFALLGCHPPTRPQANSAKQPRGTATAWHAAICAGATPLRSDHNQASAPRAPKSHVQRQAIRQK